MSQVSDVTIANQGFSAFRTELNNILGALNTSNIGSSAPSSLAQGSLWIDTSGGATAWVLKLYDGAGHISLGTINSTANTVDWTDSAVSLGVNSVDSDQYVDGSIDTIHIADDQITSAKVNLTDELHINSTASGNTLHTLLKLETDGTADGSGITIDTRTAHTRGEINFLDGTGSFDSNYVFKTATGSQLAAPSEKFRVTPTGATVTGDLTVTGSIVGGGKLGQIVESTSLDTTAISSTSFSDIDLNVTITPTATSSKILIMVDFAYTQDGADNNLANIQILRGSTGIGQHHVGYDTPGGNVGFGCHIQKLDSPSSTDAVTYKTQANTQNASSQFRPVGSASIIAIEILA